MLTFILNNLGRFDRYKFEKVFVLKSENSRRCNTIEPGQVVRYRAKADIRPLGQVRYAD